ncbi:MAG: hypothetical protein V7K43_32370 [Nostoc sp.]
MVVIAAFSTGVKLSELTFTRILTGEVWKVISAKAILTDTSVGLWGQTAIIKNSFIKLFLIQKFPSQIYSYFSQ